jgi:hypothetical protein
MVALDVPTHVRATAPGSHDIAVDLGLLRNWGDPEGYPLALAELMRVEVALQERGVRGRSVDRIVSALARYAFLVAGDCDPAHVVLWRMYAIDAVPPDVLASLTWHQVRPHLREVVVGGPGARRYFELSRDTGRLLKELRIDRGCPSGSDRVFRRTDGAGWDSDDLCAVLARLTAR